jgi:hypothetical protein
MTHRSLFSAVPAAIALVALWAASAQAQVNFRHQIPIEIPAGANGMQPGLALAYVSGGGNGPVGVGWQLAGLPAITRVNDGAGIKYAGTDTYAHSQLGVLVRLADGTYRTRKESFVRFVPSGTCGDGPCSWTAWHPDGKRSNFGVTAGSRVLGGGTASVRTWAICEAIDPFGNTWEASYTVASGLILPLSVTYTKGPNLGTFRRVEFGYEGRPDWASGYPSGDDERLWGRLKWIWVKSNGALVRQYRLDYEDGAVTARSHLVAVQEYGSDGVSTLPAQTFEWQQGGAGFTQSAAPVLNAWGAPDYTWTGDFNGDGLTDLASANGGNVNMKLSTGAGFSWNTWYVPNTWGSSTYTWPGDFNGDGKTDLATAVGGSVYVRLSTGSGFTQQIWSVPANWGGAGYVWTGDFNGDGKTDVASAIGGNVYVNVSTGSGFVQSVWSVSSSWGAPEYTWAADFDGDGRTDLASAIGGNVYVHLSTGSGFVNLTWTVPSNWSSPGQWVKVGDFNGDGKADLANAGRANVYVNLSTGAGFVQQTWPVPANWGSAEYTWAADFDGDGRTDLATAIGGNIYVNRARGNGFVQSLWPVPNVWAAANMVRIADVDGDGRRTSRAASAGTST